MCKQQREQQQQEAITLLRNRLGTLTIQNSGSLFSENEVSSCTSESSSISSISTCAAHCNSICENGHDSSQTWNHENEENEFTANSLVMQPWSPMTTAVLVLDVQNYFVLPQGYGRTRQDTRTEYFPRVKDFYDRVDNVLLPTLQDVLLASRSVGGMEVFYSIVENATHDGRERSLAHKHAGIHVPKHGFGAQVPFQIAPQDSDMVLPRTGINVFTATNLDYILRNLMSAVDRGYQVTVIKEALFLFEKSMKEDSIMCSLLSKLSNNGHLLRRTKKVSRQKGGR
ncbi:Isochorismatase-like [Plasmopara halstedii]|uniref:Isochorismatase-like n=1 Tax=Plasmopara halstedii TaxID=4781 RepID=A0A0P1AXW2_PLAHL|nr:Isochorismatase-like [Plasmopara halstedii]CEG47303.1 Isochorismatase-like [Plasmopara halstedii]|eukprot:XP_024583672.1 Isochorismatase-like [Plasmopara halstedii]